MKRTLPLAAVALTLVVGAFDSVSPAAGAVPVAGCGVQQVTATVRPRDRLVTPNPIRVPAEAITADSSRITFESGSSFLEGETIGRDEVFSLDVLMATFAQVSGGNPYRSRQPAVAADGSIIAFVSEGDITGANPDHSHEIFVYDTATGTTTQATSTTGQQDAFHPSISADGTRIAYREQLIFNAPDEDGPFAIRTLDLATEATFEVSPDAGGYPRRFGPSSAISPDGEQVAFISGQDDGQNPDHSRELFVHDLDTDTTTQLTDTPQIQTMNANSDPRFIEDGTKIVFRSDHDIDGTNPDHLRRFYVHDLAADTTTPLSIPDGVISGDGTRITYLAADDPAGTNPDHNLELFSLEIASGEVTQLTATTSTRSVHSLRPTPDGTTIAFISNRNHTGANPDHNGEIHLAHTCGPPPAPDAQIAAAFAGPYRGDDIYSSIPRATQKQALTAPAGTTRRFFVRIQNDRTDTDTLTLRAVETGAPGYQVAYYRAGHNITAAVRNGTYALEPLAPGQTANLNVRITPTVQAPPGSSRYVDLTGRSATNPVARDLARAQLTRT